MEKSGEVAPSGAAAVEKLSDEGNLDVFKRAWDEAKQRPTFAALSHDVVRHVLSLTHLHDTLSVMCVCKRWYEHAQTPLFWKPRIDETKRKAILKLLKKSDTKETQAKVIAAIMALDTFSSPHPETLRDQVQWVFCTGWLSVLRNGKCLKMVTRKTWHKTFLQEERDENDGSLEEVTYESSLVHRYEGRMVRLRHRKTGWLRLEVEKRKAPTATRLVYARKTETSSMDKGDGKWAFADGTVLEGEMVAWKGEPRYIDPPTKKGQTDDA